MTVVAINGSGSFDFEKEAAFAAVNEVCAETDPEAWKSCTIDALCPSCEALAVAFKIRLIRAFEAGRKSAMAELPIKDGQVVHPVTSKLDVGPDIKGGGAA